MKIVPYARSWGNCKMRGKKQAMMSCGCCNVENLKEKKLLKEVDKEISNAHVR